MTATPPPHTHPVRVYWEDTDAGGIVYHASHVRFFERGRTEFLRALGVNQSALADLFFTVRRMEVDYLRPARLDDLLAVETLVRTVTGARLTLRQILVRDGETIADAVVTIVAIAGDGRPRRIPEALRALFAGAVAPPQ